jgi:hypothetical protein
VELSAHCQRRNAAQDTVDVRSIRGQVPCPLHAPRTHGTRL